MDTILQTYEELHRLAEPSWQEEKTSRYLQQRLKEAGFSLTTFEGHHGFFAEIKGETEDVLMLRADMDALPYETEDGTVYRHTCGHDAHSSIVLHTALNIKDTRPKHTIRFLFQPAEETAAGALQMIRDGVLDRVVFLAGLHVRPISELTAEEASPGIQHGATIAVKGRVTGEAAHAARASTGVNALYAAGRLMRKLEAFSTDGQSAVMTKLKSGTTVNTVPDKAVFELDLRAPDNEAMERIWGKMQHAADDVETETGSRFTLEAAEHAPAAVIDLRAASCAKRAIAGVCHVADVLQTPGAEDFHHYTNVNEAPAAVMIGLGSGLTPGLHHPEMTFDLKALSKGVEIMTALLAEADRVDWGDEA
ncbi:amidohydrolase [Alkalicoccus luteus]|uniref:Amidohydrolase n=1 Tax=Alkalicoccus luteus TaxID=1237094 RepID=A0A969PTZ2_9BACI|nr:amidohydrolase [Alkalicoccus luteus]NJP37504.1 amidohydrolase [Alkalicoccus luteus]